MIEDLIKKGARIHAHTFIPLAGTPYYNKTPRKLSKETILKINKLASTGKLYGDWKKQKKIAKNICKFVKEKSSSTPYLN